MHTTIGNKYNLVFLTNSALDGVESTAIKDTKKSGEYLIYATRHSFTREGYNVHLTGVKVVNENGDLSDYIPPTPNQIDTTIIPSLTDTEGPF